MKRTGIATIWVLVIISFIGLIGAAIAQQLAIGRRSIYQLEQRSQAQWYARSALQLAQRGIRERGGDYRGETWSPVANAQVRITAEPIASQPDKRSIRVEVRYPTTNPQPIMIERSEIISIPSH